MAVLCVLYKIRCNSMYPLYIALPVPHVPVLVTRGAVIIHLYTYAPPRCRNSQYHRIFIPLSASVWNDFCDLVFDGVRLARVSRAGPMPFHWPSCSLPFCLLLFSLSLLSFYGLILWGRGLRVNVNRTHPALHCQPFLIIVIKCIQCRKLRYLLHNNALF